MARSCSIDPTQGTLRAGPGATLDDVLMSQVPGYGYAFAYSVPDADYLRLDGSEPFGVGDGVREGHNSPRVLPANTGRRVIGRQATAMVALRLLRQRGVERS